MRNTQFSVCIVGKDQEKYLEECIGHASKLSRKILYVDLGSKDSSVEKARELGATVIEAEDSFEETGRLINEATSSNWLLFQKSDEKLEVRSKRNFFKILKNKDVDAYAVTTKKTVKYELLEPFQLIKKLNQFKIVEHSLYVPELQIRLAKRKYATGCLDFIVNSSVEKLSEIQNQVTDDLFIESIHPNEGEEQFTPEDHDLRCLRGEIIHDPDPEGDLMVLSEKFTGFRVLHKGYLDSFIEGARQGFGNIKMYFPMLEFLAEDGCFREARDLFETWVQNRSEEKIYDNYIKMMGGFIYSKLLDVDNAIKYYEMKINSDNNSLTLANLAKLYLIKGEKEKAIKYFKEVEDIVGDVYLKKRILSFIDNPNWKTMTLSLCMIVRDEESHITHALESVQGIVDEIIIMDTGSSDRTREIVNEFGGKVVEMKWEDDFSAARNRCLQEITGDYVLCMDADEYIDSRHRFSLALLKNLLPEKKDVAFKTKVEPPKKKKILSVQSYLDRYKEYEIMEYQVRLFPNKAGIRFKGNIFESVNESLTQLGIEMADNDSLRITHSIGNREFREKRKISAALKSFESMVEPGKVLEGGLLFLRLGDLDRAYPWFEKSEKIKPQLASKIAMLYSRDAQPQRAKTIIKKALEYFPESSELILSLSELYYKEGNYDEVIKILRGKFETIDKDLETDDAAAAYYLYGISLIEMGDLTNGIEQIAHAHEKDPANVRYKIAGIFAFARLNQWEEALQGAGQIADEEGIDIPCEVNDFVDAGQIFISLSHHFNKEGKIEEANLCQKILEDVIETKISRKEDIQRMSAIIERLG